MSRRWKVGLALVALVAVAGAVAYVLVDEPRPTAQPSARADALARELETVINKGAWDATEAVRWTFRNNHHHLWDRRRHLGRVRWDDLEVLVNLETQAGLAKRDGKPLAGEESAQAVTRAYAAWVNDSFWLNPLAKLFDPGVERGIVLDERGQEQLLVHYTSGGRTPGDAYLWQLGPDKRPVSWKMWVSVLPTGGVEATWERWVTLATGAQVATLHKVGPRSVELTNVAGVRTLAELEPGPDPFAALAP